MNRSSVIYNGWKVTGNGRNLEDSDESRNNKGSEVTLDDSINVRTAESRNRKESLAESKAKILELLGPPPKQPAKNKPVAELPITLSIVESHWDDESEEWVDVRIICTRSFLVTPDSIREYKRLYRRMKSVKRYLWRRYWAKRSERTPDYQQRSFCITTQDDQPDHVAVCEFCGLVFRGHGTNGVTRGTWKFPRCCGWDCESKLVNAKTSARRKRERAARRPSRPCDHCNEPFTPKRTDAKFCCTKCRVYAKRKRDQTK